METNENELESSSAKVTFGTRIFPVLKSDLNNEALEVGLSSSEYGELILHNRHRYKDELNNLKLTLELKDKTIAGLNAKIGDSEKREAAIANYQKEISDLKELVAKLSSENSIFQDNRLQYLFAQVKGKKDKVENTFGDDFDIVYNSPTAVLISLIYSCELNK